MVRKAFEEYATGHHTKAEVLRRRVTALGLRTRSGETIDRAEKLPSEAILRPWSLSPFLDVFSCFSMAKAYLFDVTFEIARTFLYGGSWPARIVRLL